LALVGGGPDNITVIVADVMDTGMGSGPTEANAEVDPDATGPIGSVASVRMTAEMPRVPLPAIPEDPPAPPVYAPEEDADPAEGGVVGPPPARRSRRRRGALWLVGGLVVLAVAAVIGSFFWVRSQYYVGAQDGQVVVFRGVDGSVLGLKLSSVQEGSCEPGLNGCLPLQVDDLVQSARDQVTAGIQAGTLDDARSVISRLAGQMLPICPTVTTTTPLTPSSATSPTAAVPSGTAAPGSGQPTATPTAPAPGDAATAGLQLGTESVDASLTGTVSGLSGTGSAVATGTPLSTRALEPGVTCRVVR
jgi:protein phosphatase